MFRHRRSGVVVAVLLAFYLGSSGCGTSSDGDGDGGLQTPAIPSGFTAANMIPTAEAAANLVTLFPDLTGVILGTLEPLAAAAAGRVPAGRTATALVPLGDIGLCDSGTSVLTWDDVDNSLGLSVGDEADLDFTACDLEGLGEVLDGTVTFEFTAVNLPTNSAAQVFTLLPLIATDLGDGSSVSLIMDFALQVNQTGASDYTLVYGDPAEMDVIQVVGDDIDMEFGCFDVTHSLSLTNPTVFTLAPRGIVNSAGFVMQMGIYPPSTADTPLNFTGLFPNSGTITLFNFDGRPTGACTEVGSTGATPAVISAERITATGGNDIQVEIFDDVDITPPAEETVLTTWTELI